LKSNLLSKSETVETLENIAAQWKIQIPRTKNLTIHEISDSARLITGDNFAAIKIDKTFIPFLSETSMLEKFPKVIVDMGAVKFVCNGATVMRPGIKKYTDFDKDDIICIVEESRNKFLAVGRALVSSKELETMTKGEVVKNLHYISDEFWETAKGIKK
jgi:malignant T-cell-amplified sequence